MRERESAREKQTKRERVLETDWELEKKTEKRKDRCQMQVTDAMRQSRP